MLNKRNFRVILKVEIIVRDHVKRLRQAYSQVWYVRIRNRDYESDRVDLNYFHLLSWRAVHAVKLFLLKIFVGYIHQITLTRNHDKNIIAVLAVIISLINSKKMYDNSQISYNFDQRKCRSISEDDFKSFDYFFQSADL